MSEALPSGDDLDRMAEEERIGRATMSTSKWFDLGSFLARAEANRVLAQANGEPSSHFCEHDQRVVLHPKSECCCGQPERPCFENPYDGEGELQLDGGNDGSGLPPHLR